MPKIPRLTSKKVLKILSRYGFLLDHVSGSHYIFFHPIKHLRVTVPYHCKDIPIGTLYAIFKQAEIPIHEIRN